MQKITPFLWFDTQAEDAAKFYVSVFKNSQILSVSRFQDAGPGQNEKVAVVEFVLDGQKVTALNGGPHFKLTEAFSFRVTCDTQEEMDRLWETLSDGGEKSMCGWLKDKFGLSWQIAPTMLIKLMGDSDPKKSKAVMKALLQMRKIDIAELQRAHDEA
jgi:predicted 3-demethylubiquinone-9 3-methyltransferase (glyoxalase superfamily)